jgi:hypothetical protein
MVVVAVVSVRDDDGNVLVDVRFAAESDLGMLERRLPVGCQKSVTCLTWTFMSDVDQS